MKTLFIDCGMGAAGDMLTAALFDQLDISKQEAFITKMNNIGLEGIKVIAERSEKCGIGGTHISVLIDGAEEDESMHEHHHTHEHHHSHEHRSMHDIEHIVNDHLNISEKVKKDVLKVYELIARAESAVHGKEIGDIHFHEVGTKDAIVDITAVCILMNEIAPDKVIASPVHVGSGQVKCAHGILPVPAPATALILKGIPIYSGDIKGELCTPTGAALLKYFVNEFGPMPAMTIESIGYGMGKKDFPVANCVRVMIGEDGHSNDEIIELSFNVDDMPGETIGFLSEELLSAGALEVFAVPIQMKKSRPGNMICVFVKEDNKEKMVSLIFKHSTTIGIRENKYNRYTLERNVVEVETEYGPIRKKVSKGYGVIREKWEYEDLARIAKERQISINDILVNINNATLK